MQQPQIMLLKDELATADIAQQLSSLIQAPCIIFLQGELGAGKTTFSRHFIQNLGYTGLVTSPTYNLVQSYNLDKSTIHHFDLYRLSDTDRSTMQLFDEYFTEDAICLIEWPQNCIEQLPNANIHINLIYKDNMRLLEITTDTRYDNLLNSLKCP